MLRRVWEGDVPVDAALIANDEASLVEVDDGAAHPVAEPEPAVVAAAEDLLADPILVLAQHDAFAAEPAVTEHQLVCSLVEFVDVSAPVGEHDVTARAA